MYFSFISVPPIFTSVACSECWSTIQNVSLSLGIFLWGGGGRVLGGGLDWLALGHLQGVLVHVGASHSLLLLGIGVSIPVGVGVGGLGGGLVWLNTSSQRRVKIYFWSFYAKNTGHM